MIRTVRMTFQKECVNDFLDIFHGSKEKIRNMPGCIHLELWEDLKKPNVFTTYSKWDSEENLNNYRNSDVFGEVWPKTKALFDKAPEAASYEVRG